MIPESADPERDYPQMAAERGRIEPAPRRVRGYFDNVLVFDTTVPAMCGRCRTTHTTTSHCLTSARSICSTRTTRNGCNWALLGCIR